MVTATIEEKKPILHYTSHCVWYSNTFLVYLLKYSGISISQLENAPDLPLEDVVEIITILRLNQNAEKPATKANRMTKKQVSIFPKISDYNSGLYKTHAFEIFINIHNCQ